MTAEGRRRGLFIEEIEERFRLDGKALEPLEHARLLRKEARYGSFHYEISHDRLAEAIRESRRWRLPRHVKIGLAMVVAVVVIGAPLFYYFESQSRRRAEAARKEAEHVLDYIIFTLQDRLTDLGERALLDDMQKVVDAYYEQMGDLGESDEILRTKAVAFDNRGDLLFNRGNLASASASYQSALQIREKLAARDPANTEWQRDLSISHNRIGDVHQAQGDLEAALSAYQQSLQIAEKLAARDPANPQWQADLVVSLWRMADVLEHQNPPQRKEAAANYQRALDILRPLAAGNRLTADQKGWIANVQKRLDALKKKE